MATSVEMRRRGQPKCRVLVSQIDRGAISVSNCRVGEWQVRDQDLNVLGEGRFGLQAGGWGAVQSGTLAGLPMGRFGRNLG